MNIIPIHKNLTYLLSYVTGFIFLIAIAIYIYILVVDKLENAKHTTEEISWMYGFLCILIIGFIVSYYVISKSIEDGNNKINKINKIKKSP